MRAFSLLRRIVARWRVVSVIGMAVFALAFDAPRGIDHASGPRTGDDVELERAEILVARGEAEQALHILRAVEPSVRSRHSAPIVERWLRTYASAAGGAAQWRDAYRALAEAQRMDEQHARALGQQLRRTQGVALVLLVVLLLATLAPALRKVRRSRRMHLQATTDELTGVANRRALMIWLEEEFARTRSAGDGMAVLILDVDHFKRINDTHGHAMGDIALKHLARVLQERLREGDRLGRVGGEEFVVILPRTSVVEAQGVAERMRAAVAGAPLWHPDGDISITVSVGVAMGDGSPTADAVLSRADLALYRAKAWGRDRVVVHEAEGGAAVAAPGDAAPAVSSPAVSSPAGSSPTANAA
ncbi:MAG: GGDEF domain-containing protein [Gemmatimonadaceae bacterium]|nr:GGDEF domain-containing protein [Gemmatimonadaceae bacterium]